MAWSAPRWTTAHSVAAVAGALAFATGSALGLTRGHSTAWATVALAGLVVLLVGGAGPMAAGLVRERRTAAATAAVRPDDGPRRLLLASRPSGAEVGVREDDGVERWLPVGTGPGSVAQARTSPQLVELLDGQGAVVQVLQRARWLPDAAALTAVRALCTRAGLTWHRAGRDRVRPRPGSDLPEAVAVWPALLPRAGLLAVVGGCLGGLDGVRLLLRADGAPETVLGVAFLLVAAGSWLLVTLLRRP